MQEPPRTQGQAQVSRPDVRSPRMPFMSSALILEICVETPRKSGEIVDVFRGLARAIYADTAPSTPISTFFGGGLGGVARQEKFLRRRFQANLRVNLRCLPRPPF